MIFHPLPAGLSDALPREARVDDALVRSLLGAFARHGHELVSTPLFEHVEILELGLGSRALSDMLTFVDPESGEICALRPDMTPQIARLVASRLAGMATPMRLAYEGSVVRRRAGRARKHRQIHQVGAELVGLAGLAGDLELFDVLGAALRSVGLEGLTIDLTDASIVRALVDDVAPEQAWDIGLALAQKDEKGVERAAAGIAHASTLAALTHLSGGKEALAEAHALLGEGPAGPGLARLAALHDAIERLGIFARVVVDVGEIRELDYYTGCIFHVFAEGPGEPIAGGGRYDTLLGRFGVDACAVGFAFDLENVAWARRRAGIVDEGALRVVVVADAALASRLRAEGIAAVVSSTWEEAAAYGEAWGYRVVVGGGEAMVVGEGKRVPLALGEGNDVASSLREVVAAFVAR